MDRLKKHPLGFWEIADKPTPAELQRYYAEKYYQEAKGSYEVEYSKAELAYFRAKIEQRYAVVNRYRSISDGEVGTMLDVGCGEGYALAFFREHGWRVKGFDFSSAGVESKNPDCLDALVTGDVFGLLQAEISDGKVYDVVWLQNVLEHVIDPIKLLESLRSLLAPRGIAIITVPNDCSLTQQCALESKHIDRPFWIAPPDHLSYFDYYSLANTAIATGYDCLDILGDFPVEWFLFHPGSNYVANKSVGKAAHKARVEIENLLHKQKTEDVIKFWSAAAKLGIGRDITAFLRSSEKH